MTKQERGKVLYFDATVNPLQVTMREISESISPNAMQLLPCEALLEAVLQFRVKNDQPQWRGHYNKISGLGYVKCSVSPLGFSSIINFTGEEKKVASGWSVIHGKSELDSHGSFFEYAGDKYVLGLYEASRIPAILQLSHVATTAQIGEEVKLDWAQIENLYINSPRNKIELLPVYGAKLPKFMSLTAPRTNNPHYILGNNGF